MIVYVVVVGSLVWVFWKIVSPFFLKSPLDVVPGPTRKSLLSGMYALPLLALPSLIKTCPSGNLEQLFDRDAWGFHDHVGAGYGSVVKIHAVLGVSTYDALSSASGSSTSLLPA